MHAGPIDVQTHFLPSSLVDALAARTEIPRLVDGRYGRLVEYGPGAAYPVPLTAPPSEHIRKLYVDSAAAWPPALELVVELLGADRLLYATDHPFWDPDRTRDALSEADLSDVQRAAIERDNAIRVLGLSAGAAR